MQNMKPVDREAVMLDRTILHDIIVDVWCPGLDTLNWRSLRALYDDEVFIHWHGVGMEGMPEAKHWPTDEWLGYSRAMEGFDVTQHNVSNFRYTFSGDKAKVRTNLYAEHHIDDASIVMGAIYTHDFRRDGASWKVIGVELDVWWLRGDRGLMMRAYERALGGQAPRSELAVLLA
jgi:hypothetical protein